MTALPAQRLDRWLWHARIAPSRSHAARLVAAGNVRVNRIRARKAAQPVRPGDVITTPCAGRVRVLRVMRLADQRVGAPLATVLYEEIALDAVG